MNVKILSVDDDKIQRVKLKGIVSRDLAPLAENYTVALNTTRPKTARKQSRWRRS
jgi:hypothetical protein